MAHSLFAQLDRQGAQVVVSPELTPAEACDQVWSVQHFGGEGCEWMQPDIGSQDEKTTFRYPSSIFNLRNEKQFVGHVLRVIERFGITDSMVDVHLRDEL